MTRIWAAHRLAAMTIKNGDNFSDSKKMLKDLYARKLSEFKEVEPGVFVRTQGLSVWYVLATLKTQDPNKTLKQLGSINGFMSVLRFPTNDEVYSVFVDPKLQGKGLGKRLYTIAHKYCKKFLASSEDLGSMSLGVWLSLYRDNEKIQFVVANKKLPRKDVHIEGLNVVWTYKGKSVNLVGEKLPLFTLRWPK